MREDAVSAYLRTHEKHALEAAGGDLLGRCVHTLKPHTLAPEGLIH